MASDIAIPRLPVLFGSFLRIAFPVLALGIFSTFRGPEIFKFQPQSHHQWRQSDCLSLALNYYQFELPFLEPQVHNLLAEEGKSVSEFPVLYSVHNSRSR